MKKNLYFLLILLFSTTTFNLNSKGPHSYPQTPIETGDFLILDNSIDNGWFDPGMFATFCSVLGCLNFYENGNYAGFKVNLSIGRYLDTTKGLNWWDYFFEPISFGNENAHAHYFSSLELCKLTNTVYPLSRKRGNELIQRYIHVKPHITDKVDEFIATHFEGKYVIGVHHRGTDKQTEFKLIPFKKTEKTIKSIIDSLDENEQSNILIYTATDETNFIKYMDNAFPGVVIYNDFVRSNNNTPLHDNSHPGYANNYQKGEEALIDCLLLSKCNRLVRPNSNLSWVSSFFNPLIPQTVLNEGVENEQQYE